MSVPLGEASVLIVPDTTKFRALLEAEVLAATRTVSTGTALKGTLALGSATASLTASTTALTAATTASTSSQTRAGIAAAEEATAQKVAAKAAADHAAAEATLARGAAATTLSLLGIRGATLAASARFLAGAAAVTLLAKSIHAASSEQEAAARTAVVFGDKIEKNLAQGARGLADSFALSSAAALKFEGIIGLTLENLGLAPQRAANLSVELVKLAADMAALANVPVDQTLRALQLAVSGNLRGLRQFGITIRQADVAALALRETGKKTASSLTAQELATARLNLILEQSVKVHRAAEERMGGLAGQSRRLTANLHNLEASIGGILLPYLLQIAKDSNAAISGFIKLGEAAKGLKEKFIGSVPGGERLFSVVQKVARFTGPFAWIHELEAAQRAFSGTKTEADATGNSIFALTRIFEATAPPLEVLAGDISGFPWSAFVAGANQAAIAAATFQAQLAGLQRAGVAAQQGLLKAQVAGATPEQQIALIQRDITAQQKVVALAHSGSKAKFDALRQIKSDQDQIASLQAGIVSDAKAAASAAQSAADKARAAREKADQAFLDALGLARGRAEFRVSQAAATKGIQDDLVANRALQRLLKQQIRAIRARGLDAQEEAQALLDLRSSLLDAQTARKALIEQQRQDAETAKQQRLANREQLLQLNLEYAQILENIKAEIRARQALIKYYQIRAHAISGSRVAAAELRNKIAQERAEIKKLREEQKKRKDELRSLEFEFLQAQQGFAATILSNLLPRSAVAGAVGGTVATPSSATTTPPGVPRPLSGEAQRAAASGLGVTQGQGSTQIDLLRQIVRLLSGQSARQRNPEATHQRVVSKGDMGYGV